MEAVEAHGLVSQAAWPLSIIVPLYNEAAGLAARARDLMRGLPEGCEVIFVCNGCTDNSEQILREVVRETATILTCDKGKVRAIRLGELHASLFPRFYVDADVDISGRDLGLLASKLGEGIELVSPSFRMRTDHAGDLVSKIVGFWQQLPYGKGGFHAVLGVTRTLRERWGEFPDVIADDTFIEGQALTHEKLVDRDVTASITAPRTWWGWVRVRARWQQGIDQLRRNNYPVAKSPGQIRSVLRAIFIPGKSHAAFMYCFSVILARSIARTGFQRTKDWFTDETSRQPTNRPAFARRK